MLEKIAHYFKMPNKSLDRDAAYSAEVATSAMKAG
jgi:hypothetical protein